MIPAHKACDLCCVMRLYVALAALVISTPIASAERRRVAKPQHDEQQVRAKAPEPPPPPPPPSVTLRQGVVAGSVAIEASVSAGNVFAPLSIAPDLSVGITDELTLSAVHSGSALSGFRGGAGAGV